MKTPEQEMALTYEIGDCYEERRSGTRRSTTSSASRGSNPALRRHARVRGRARAAPRARARARKPAAKAVGAEAVDEFDAVLDDLLGGGKLP